MARKFTTMTYANRNAGEQGHTMAYDGVAPQGLIVSTQCATPGCGSYCGMQQHKGELATVNRTREAAIRSGWVNIGERRWLCPMCVAEAQQGVLDAEDWKLLTAEERYKRYVEFARSGGASRQQDAGVLT